VGKTLTLFIIIVVALTRHNKTVCLCQCVSIIFSGTAQIGHADYTSGTLLLP